MLRFTFKSVHLNIPLTLLYIKILLWSNPLMIMKWTKYSYSSSQSTMMIFWMLTSRCFRLARSLLLKKIIQSLICCFIKTEEQILESQNSCQTFLCLSQPKLMWNWITKTRNMPKEFGLFNVVLLTASLHIQWNQFIIVHVTLSNTISLDALKYYVGFQQKPEPIEKCVFKNPQGRSCRSIY